MKQGEQLGLMIEWENGEITEEDEVRLFQSLLNSGLAWQLQGCYGRHTHALLQAGLISAGVAA